MYFGSLPNSCTWHFYRTTTNTCWCTWEVLVVFLASLPFHHSAVGRTSSEFPWNWSQLHQSKTRWSKGANNHPAVGRTSTEFPWTSQHVIRVPRRYCPEIAGLMLHVILHPHCINTKTRSSKGANQFPRNSRGNVTHYPPSPNWSQCINHKSKKVQTNF